MRLRILSLGIPALCLVALGACSSSSSGQRESPDSGTPNDGGDRDSGSKTRPQLACEDSAAAAAAAGERCGGDYQTVYNNFVQSVAQGDCANIIQIRDENALRQTCLPSFTTISCQDFFAGNLDESCLQQLLH